MAELSALDTPLCQNDMDSQKFSISKATLMSRMAHISKLPTGHNATREERPSVENARGSLRSTAMPTSFSVTALVTRECCAMLCDLTYPPQGFRLTSPRILLAK